MLNNFSTKLDSNIIFLIYPHFHTQRTLIFVKITPISSDLTKMTNLEFSMKISQCLPNMVIFANSDDPRVLLTKYSSFLGMQMGVLEEKLSCCYLV